MHQSPSRCVQEGVQEGGRRRRPKPVSRRSARVLHRARHGAWAFRQGAVRPGMRKPARSSVDSSSSCGFSRIVEFQCGFTKCRPCMALRAQPGMCSTAIMRFIHPDVWARVGCVPAAASTWFHPANASTMRLSIAAGFPRLSAPSSRRHAHSSTHRLRCALSR